MQSNSYFEKNTNKKRSKTETEEVDNKTKKRKNRVKSKRELADELNRSVDDYQNR